MQFKVCLPLLLLICPAGAGHEVHGADVVVKHSHKKKHHRRTASEKKLPISAVGISSTQTKATPFLDELHAALEAPKEKTTVALSRVEDAEEEAPEVKAAAPKDAEAKAASPKDAKAAAAETKADPSMPFSELEPFGRETTGQELTEASIRESDAMIDQIEKAEIAEEERSVFRALTRLRGAALASFDGIARAHQHNIQEYALENQYRKVHPVQHLASEEADVSRWAFPSNAD
mmetsp:Transcript_36852/g.88001  ORF Transcript_36852/g.88001 Transcript_36852/m.88001 type:complete len:233 (-) Transcript_36852:39-737(-)